MACRDTAADVFSAEWGLRFEGNRYHGDGNAWAWDGRLLSGFDEWRAFGHDATGQLDPLPLSAGGGAEGGDGDAGSAGGECCPCR